MTVIPSKLTISAILSLITFLVSTAAIVLLAPADLSQRPWQSFDILLVAGGADEAEAVRRLTAAGEEVLHLNNAEVDIEDFNGGDRVAVADIPDRFDPVDPRLDPFVQALPGLFRAQRGEREMAVLYLPRSDRRLERWITIRRILPDIPFVIAGREPIIPLAGALAVALSIAPVLLLQRRRRWMIAATAGVVALHAAFAGVEAVIPAAILGIAWSFWHEHSYELERELLVHPGSFRLDREQVPAAVFLLLAIIGGFVAAVSRAAEAPGSGASYLLVIAALAALSTIGFTLHAGRVGRSEHPLFAPRPILRARVEFPGVVGSIGLLVLFSVGMVVLGRSGDQSTGAVTIPVAEHTALGQASADFVPSGAVLVEGIRSMEPGVDPLSTAGYLAHRWYQDTLAYGGTFDVPDSGAVVELQRLRRGDSGLEAYNEVVGRFDDGWIGARFSGSQPSAYRVFVEEAGAFRVVRTPVPLHSVDLVRYLRSMALLLLPFVALSLGMRLPYRGLLGTVGASSRSQRQEL